MQIKIGTRKSILAKIQTNMVIAAINKAFPEIKCIPVFITTTGDKITDRNLYDIGGKALFLKEIEEELLAGRIDIAMHSLKDVPGILPKGLVISAYLKREDPRDCFVSYKYKSLSELPAGAKVGTSSVRRKIIMQQMRPDLEYVQFRGNIDTRLRKLKEGEVAATILATAGLKRANLLDPDFCHILTPEEMLPAAGQGIVCVQARAGDSNMLDICKKINHMASWSAAQAERSFLAYLDASCDTPLSAYAELEGEQINARYMLSDIKGTNVRYHQIRGNISEAESIGIKAAQKLEKI